MTRWGTVGPVAAIAAVSGGIVSGATGDYGDADDDDNVLISPPNWSFIIWVPIYLGAIAYAVNLARPSRRTDPLVRATRTPYAASVLASGLWVRTARRPRLQMAVIASTAATALAAQYRSGGVVPDLPAGDPGREREHTWLTRVPIGLFAGWITLASVVATSQAAVELGATRLKTTSASIALLLTAGAAGAAVAATTRGWAYPLTLVWGLGGIVAARRRGDPAIATAAGVASAAIAAVASLRSHRRAPRE
jgi:hypothetical protein